MKLVHLEDMECEVEFKLDIMHDELPQRVVANQRDMRFDKQNIFRRRRGHVLWSRSCTTSCEDVDFDRDGRLTDVAIGKIIYLRTNDTSCSAKKSKGREVDGQRELQDWQSGAVALAQASPGFLHH